MIIPDDGIADGGTPYTRDCRKMNGDSYVMFQILVMFYLLVLILLVAGL